MDHNSDVSYMHIYISHIQGQLQYVSSDTTVYGLKMDE